VIVEVGEDQHREPVIFWDKPDHMTVSGVNRREQRGIHYRLKRAAARADGYTVLEIECSSYGPALSLQLFPRDQDRP
jgi:hypothetical protein